MNKYNIKRKEQESATLTGVCFLTFAVLVMAVWGVNRYKNFSSPSSRTAAGTESVAVQIKLESDAPAHITLEGGGPGLVITNCTFEHTFDDLLDAIEWVESKGDPNVIGDGGLAVGAYQIHKIYVDDVNRILGTWESKAVNVDGEIIYHFVYADRFDRNRSRMMVWIYLTHYGDRWFGDWYPTHDARTYHEYIARIHNGGPDGWKKESTKAYWEKVKARMAQ